MRKICMVIFLSMISVNGFGASQTVQPCFNHAVCQEKGAGASCGTNKTCKKVSEGCFECTLSLNAGVIPSTRWCEQQSCEPSDADTTWTIDTEIDNLYRKSIGCEYQYSSVAGVCVEIHTYDYACKSGYYVHKKYDRFVGLSVQCIPCPNIEQGNNPQSGDIKHGDITLNTSTSVTSCYLPKSIGNDEYTDVSGTFVVTGDKCNATSQ